MPAASRTQATGQLRAFSGPTAVASVSYFLLSLQLSFAVIPLVLFTGQRSKMGRFVNPPWIKFLAWSTAAIIVALNVKYLFDAIARWVK